MLCFRGARGARAAAGAGAACWGERRARNMLSSIKGFWKVCRYGDLYMVTYILQLHYVLRLGGLFLSENVYSVEYENVFGRKQGALAKGLANDDPFVCESSLASLAVT